MGKPDFRALASKIYLTPISSVIEDCESFLEQIGPDLDLLRSIDVTDTEIFYINKDLSFDSTSFESHEKFVEQNNELLIRVVDSYEFFNDQE